MGDGGPDSYHFELAPENTSLITALLGVSTPELLHFSRGGAGPRRLLAGIPTAWRAVGLGGVGEEGGFSLKGWTGGGNCRGGFGSGGARGRPPVQNGGRRKTGREEQLGGLSQMRCGVG